MMDSELEQRANGGGGGGNMEDLEALLNDLQNTTANLKRANLASKYQQQQQHQGNTVREEALVGPQRATVTTIMATSTSTQQPRFHSTTTATAANVELQDLEQLLEDYTLQRGRQQVPTSAGRPTVESLLGELDTAVADGQEFRTTTFPSSAMSRETEKVTTTLTELKISNGTNGTSRHSLSPRPQDETDGSSGGGGDHLDSMLGTLQDDLSKQGINTIPKGDCAACSKSIVGQVVIALGKMWHPEHFSCSHCGSELASRNFFERSGRAYCENDYHNLFSPRCGYCNGPIKDKCVTALDQTWHPEHFLCDKCGKEFGEEGFHEKDGRAYCREDYLATYAPRCRGCQHAITNKYITALNTQWHPECFVCQECRERFTDGCGSYFDHDGQPYCETHYHEKRGSLCAGCHKPISGRCVTAMGKKFHPEHFVCSFCLNQLNKGTFKEHELKPYCHKCFNKLFH